MYVSPRFLAFFSEGPIRVFFASVTCPLPRGLVKARAWCVEDPLKVVREMRVATGVPSLCNLCFRDWITGAVGGLELFEGQPRRLLSQHFLAAGKP